MASKKKQTSKKKKKAEDSQGSFWPLTGAVVLFIIAFLLSVIPFDLGFGFPLIAIR